MRVLVFRWWGRYGMFRKFSTNVFPDTYGFPPPTAVHGMLGRILGLGREEYPEVFKNSRVAVRILAPVQKLPFPTNWIKTKKGEGTVTVEDYFKKVPQSTPNAPKYLVNPDYRIYIHVEEQSLRNQIKEAIKERRYHLTPYLGKAKCISQVEYIGEFTANELPKPYQGEIHSVIFWEFDQESLPRLITRNLKRLATDRVAYSYQEISLPKIGVLKGWKHTTVIYNPDPEPPLEFENYTGQVYEIPELKEKITFIYK